MTKKHLARVKHRVAAWTSSGAKDGYSYEHMGGGFVFMEGPDNATGKNLRILHICDPSYDNDKPDAPWWIGIKFKGRYKHRCSQCKAKAPSRALAVIRLRELEI